MGDLKLEIRPRICKPGHAYSYRPEIVERTRQFDFFQFLHVEELVSGIRHVESLCDVESREGEGWVLVASCFKTHRNFEGEVAEGGGPTLSRSLTNAPLSPVSSPFTRAK